MLFIYTDFRRPTPVITPNLATVPEPVARQSLLGFPRAAFSGGWKMVIYEISLLHLREALDLYRLSLPIRTHKSMSKPI